MLATMAPRYALLAVPLAAASIASLALPGCFIDGDYPLSEEFGICAIGEPGEPGVPDGLITYYTHAKPIIDAKCNGCHGAGGIAPFALETHDEAFVARDLIRDAVRGKLMPPWQPDDCCNDYRWDRSLTDEEIALLTAWIDQGAVAGDPAEEGSPLEIDRGGLSRVDVTITMPEPFAPTPLIGRDEIRCFVIDWPVDRDVFVRGINVVPGDRTMVHHVVVAAVSGGVVNDLRAREGEDGRPGWGCYGEIIGNPRVSTVLGGWAPGSQGVEFPDELGIQVPAGSSIILNVHYDLGRGSSEDQTSVELMISDQVDGELTSTAVWNPLWPVGNTMSIDAGDPDAQVYFSWDPTVFFDDRKLAIHSVNVHMHELGTVGRLAILRADGSVDCLLHITSWDYDWSSEYYLETPAILEPGDQLFVECRWDNTAGNQRIVNGELEIPRDIAWGADEEMCIGFVGIVELGR